MKNNFFASQQLHVKSTKAMKQLEKEQPIYLSNISCYLNFSFFFRFSIKEPQQLKPKAHLPSLSNGKFPSFLQYYISISSSIKSVDKAIYLFRFNAFLSIRIMICDDFLSIQSLFVMTTFMYFCCVF